MHGQPMSNTRPYTTRFTKSRGGTTIGYCQFGSGPDLILVHGGMQSSQNFTRLAIALSDAFTVYVPDRRGRGLSGPHGESYGLERECEDFANAADLNRKSGGSGGTCFSVCH